MKENLKIISSIFGWCTILGIVFVLIWWIGYQSGMICSVSEKLFALNQHECSLMNYGGIGLLKMSVYVLFLIPWIAMKIVLRRLK